MGFPIPKIIHQTWKNKDIPEEWRLSPEMWQKFHPDWEYRLWTDEDNREYIKNNYSWFLPYYDAFPYNIQRADAIRYFILKDFGGIYSDLDTVPTKPIDEYFTSKNGAAGEIYLINSANATGFLTNSFMASQKGVPFWNEIIKEMTKPLPSYIITKHFIVMNSTGPAMFTRVAKRYNRSFINLPRVLFNPFKQEEIDEDKNIVEDPDIVLTNLRGCSWHAWDSTLINLLVKYKVGLIILGIVIVLTLFFFAFRYWYLYVKLEKRYYSLLVPDSHYQPNYTPNK